MRKGRLLSKKTGILLLVASLLFGTLGTALAAEGEVEQPQTIIEFNTLDKATTEQNVPSGTGKKDLKLPQELKVTDDGGNHIAITGVLWDCMEPTTGYEGDTPGEYLFKPVLPEGYTVDASVKTPQITVTVQVAPSASEQTPMPTEMKPGSIDTEQSGSISGTVWVDANENGAKDTDESGLYGYTVNMYAADDLENAVATATTSIDGTYTFVDIAPGLYILGIQVQEIGGTEYLLPLEGFEDDNHFKLTDDWINAYTKVIEIRADSVITDINAGVRIPPVIRALAAGDFVVTGGNLSNPVFCDSLADAITAIHADTGVAYIITAYDNDTSASELTIEANKNVTLISSGTAQTILHPNGGRHFSVNGSLTLNNIVLDGGNPTSSSGGVRVNRGGVLTMDSGAVIQNCRANDGGGVYTSPGSTFNMAGGTIRNNRAFSGGGVYVYSAIAFNMSGGTISGNTVNGGGGGVFVSDNRTFNMTGGTISGNTGKSGGGGVWVNYGGTFNMSGGTISGNTTSFFGGGVYVNTTGTFNVAGGTISGNIANYSGGGVCVDSENGRMNVTGSVSIINNSAINNGGGIYTRNTSYATLDFTRGSITFSGNQAEMAYMPPNNPSTILNVSYMGTSIFDHPLNNFDINYTDGRSYTTTYSITYDENEATGGSVPGVKYYLPNDSATISDAGNLVKSGYTFSGWNSQANGDGTMYQPDDTINITTDATLYAQWTAIPPTVYSFAMQFGIYTGQVEGLAGIVDAPFHKFLYLTVNSVILNDACYDSIEGSTIITLKASYLNTLANGTYTARAEFSDGYADSTFTINRSNDTTYTVEATAGSHGSVSPSGTVAVIKGDNQTFTFTPGADYEVDTVTVDGRVVSFTNNCYTFTSMQEGHTLHVTFKVKESSGLPWTGDNSSMWLLVIIVLLSTLVGLCILARRKYRKPKRDIKNKCIRQ